MVRTSLLGAVEPWLFLFVEHSPRQLGRRIWAQSSVRFHFPDSWEGLSPGCPRATASVAGIVRMAISQGQCVQRPPTLPLAHLALASVNSLGHS
jgi:hypothetical protein